jgi:hypothetical protein
VPSGLREPGGENSFCPFRLLQLRLELEPSHEMDEAVLDIAFRFERAGSAAEKGRA